MIFILARLAAAVLIPTILFILLTSKPKKERTERVDEVLGTSEKVLDIFEKRVINYYVYRGLWIILISMIIISIIFYNSLMHNS